VFPPKKCKKYFLGADPTLLFKGPAFSTYVGPVPLKGVRAPTEARVDLSRDGPAGV